MGIVKSGFAVWLMVCLAVAPFAASADERKDAAPKAAGQKKDDKGDEKGLDDDLLDRLSTYTQTHLNMPINNPAALAALATALVIYGGKKLYNVLWSERSVRSDARARLDADKAVKEFMDEVARHVPRLKTHAETASKALDNANTHNAACLSWFRYLTGITVGGAALAAGGYGYWKAHTTASRNSRTIRDYELERKANEVAAPLERISAEKAAAIRANAEARVAPVLPGSMEVMRRNRLAIRASLVRPEVAQARGKATADNTAEVDAALARLGEDQHLREAVRDAFLAVVPASSDPTATLDQRLDGVLALPRGNVIYERYLEDAVEEILRRSMPTVLPRAKIREFVRTPVIDRLKTEVDQALRRR